MSDIVERLRTFPGWDHCDPYEAADEIERLQEAKRAALAIADERSKENCELRQEIGRLRARLSEIDHPAFRR